MGSGDRVLSQVSSGGVLNSMRLNQTLERSKHAVDYSSKTECRNSETQHQNRENNQTFRQSFSPSLVDLD